MTDAGDGDGGRGGQNIPPNLKTIPNISTSHKNHETTLKQMLFLYLFPRKGTLTDAVVGGSLFFSKKKNTLFIQMIILYYLSLSCIFIYFIFCIFCISYILIYFVYFIYFVYLFILYIYVSINILGPRLPWASWQLVSPPPDLRRYCSGY